MSVTTAKPTRDHVKWFRADPIYEHWQKKCAPRGPFAKAWYIFFYLLPGIVAYTAINVRPVYAFFVELTGLSGKNWQFCVVIAITFGWHMLLPIVVLNRADHLSPRQALSYIGLDRVDWKSVFVAVPIAFSAWLVISIPYMHYVAPSIKAWTEGIAWMKIPSYSVFQPGPDSLFTYPGWMLAIFLVGNFIGEEMYFRGYLMKKTAFLGAWNWLVGSVLFAIYHLWQIPQTWPLIPLVGIFGALMQVRKDLYSCVLLHVLINLAWPPLMMIASASIWK